MLPAPVHPLPRARGAGRRRGLTRDAPPRRSVPGRPVLDGDLLHRKVLGIAARQSSPDRLGGGGDQTVRLREGPAASRMVPPPPPRTSSLIRAETSLPKAGEESPGMLLLARAQAPVDLLHVHRADEGSVTLPPEVEDALGGPPAAENIDEHGRVEENCSHQPTRRRSPRRSAWTHAAGSGSHSWPSSGMAPSAASISSHRLASSRARRTASAMKLLRRRDPTLRSSSATRASSRLMCTRMPTR